MSDKNGALPERYRRATSIRPGYEVRLKDGNWAQVATHMHITFPADVVTMTLVSGERVTTDPRVGIMSRRPPVVAR